MNKNQKKRFILLRRLRLSKKLKQMKKDWPNDATLFNKLKLNAISNRNYVISPIRAEYRVRRPKENIFYIFDKNRLYFYG